MTSRLPLATAFWLLLLPASSAAYAQSSVPLFVQPTQTQTPARPFLMLERSQAELPASGGSLSIGLSIGGSPQRLQVSGLPAGMTAQLVQERLYLTTAGVAPGEYAVRVEAVWDTETRLSEVLVRVQAVSAAPSAPPTTGQPQLPLVAPPAVTVPVMSVSTVPVTTATAATPAVSVATPSTPVMPAPVMPAPVTSSATAPRTPLTLWGGLGSSAGGSNLRLGVSAPVGPGRGLRFAVRGSAELYRSAQATQTALAADLLLSPASSALYFGPSASATLGKTGSLGIGGVLGYRAGLSSQLGYYLEGRAQYQRQGTGTKFIPALNVGLTYRF